MSVTIKPIGDRILVKQLEDSSQRVAGGIILPDSAAETPTQAEVVSLGTGREDETGALRGFAVKVGDRVLVSKYAGTAVMIDKTDYRLVREDEILSVLAEDEPRAAPGERPEARVAAPSPAAVTQAAPRGTSAPPESPTDGLAESIIRTAMQGLSLRRLLKLIGERIEEETDPEDVWRYAELTGETAKPLIETRSGTAYTTEQAAERLDVTEQTVRNWARKGELIYYPAIQGRKWLFPHWQFIRATPVQIRPWVRPLILAYGHNGWGLLDFLTVPRADRNGASYLSLLWEGEVDQVLAAARRSNPD